MKFRREEEKKTVRIYTHKRRIVHSHFMNMDDLDENNGVVTAVIGAVLQNREVKKGGGN